MLLYVTLGSNDLARSRKFYDAALAPLGMTRNHVDEDELGYGAMNRTPEDRENVLWVGRPYLKLPANWGNGTMIALSAKTREIVDAFHVAALANGGTDEGAPGLRPYHASFYACYVRDPDGNKLSVVCEAAD
jgi:catechol 2,3-dioxygenase-like lactoylglutathione lyase family enzyme